ncbi:helix-turn-helix transcriptional regulator [Microbacterium sp.]|jgi:excisionase family DNA binding protein|uniref:helix-turn-helix transcriptional regulator n=1 Tax=Microbacterium sp. TaxID=51671 RepID=UPI0037C62BD5
MNKLLSVKEAAVQIGTTEKGLRWMIHKGNAPKSALIGGTRRMFRQSDIDAYIAEAFEAAK